MCDKTVGEQDSLLYFVAFIVTLLPGEVDLCQTYVTHISMLLIMVQERHKYIWEPTPFLIVGGAAESTMEGMLRHEMTSCQCHTKFEQLWRRVTPNARARALL